MHDFERKLITEWRRLDLPREGRVVVAVSGGADSVSLLMGLVNLVGEGKLGLEITVAHYNHGLRGEDSKADENFVRDLCNRFDLPLAVGQMGGPSGNLEQFARDSRYDFLQSVAENLDALAVTTAHTMNDQAETFLQNLIRGSGPTGLGAMSPVRSFHPSDPTGGLLLIRPLLSWCMREESEAYCDSLGIAVRYDSMNDDLRFSRVKIRKLLLPMMKDLNPKVIPAIARTAELVRTRSDESRNDIDPTENPRVSRLKEMGEEELNSFLMAWLSSKRGGLRGIGSAHIRAIAKLVTSPKSGRVVEIPGKCRVVKNRGQLLFEGERV